MTFPQSPDYLTSKRLTQNLGEDLEKEMRRRIIDQVLEASAWSGLGESQKAVRTRATSIAAPSATGRRNICRNGATVSGPVRAGGPGRCRA